MSGVKSNDPFADLLASGMSPEEIMAELKARQEQGIVTPLGNETEEVQEKEEEIEELIEEIHEKPTVEQETEVSEEKESIQEPEQPKSTEPATQPQSNPNRSETRIYVDNFNMLYRRLLVDLKSIKSLSLLDVSDEELAEMENAVNESKRIGDLFNGVNEPDPKEVNAEWLNHYSSISRIHRKYFRLSTGAAKKDLIQGVFDTFNAFTDDPDKLVKMKNYAEYLANETALEKQEREEREARIKAEADAKAKADAANLDLLGDFVSSGKIDDSKINETNPSNTVSNSSNSSFSNDNKQVDYQKQLDDSIEFHEDISKTISGESKQEVQEDAQPIQSQPKSFASTVTSSSTAIDDEDEDEDTDYEYEDEDDEDVNNAGFLARMEALEASLTCDYEIEEGEVPTLEKIEEIKSEHGDLAAKEYIASLSQEDREDLARQLIAKKQAQAELKQAPAAESNTETPKQDNPGPSAPTGKNPFE